MKTFKERISSADDRALMHIIENICELIGASGFTKAKTKHMAQALLRNPRVNKATRDAYTRLCGLVANDKTLRAIVLSDSTLRPLEPQKQYAV